MKRLLVYLLAIGLGCFSTYVTETTAQQDDLRIFATTSFTIRDDDLDGEPDDIDDDPNGPFWGLITNSDFQDDEFYLEFDISSLEQVESVKFYFHFPESIPLLPPGGATIDLEIATYEGDGIADISKFGIGDFFDSILISNNKVTLFSIDVTSVVKDFIDSGIQFLGIRLYDPFSSESTSDNGRPAQLNFGIGYLGIIPKIELEDTMQPTGAVHAHPNVFRSSDNGKICVRFSGYVVDEVSILRDGEGIGVSEAFLIINGQKIVLKDDSKNLLDENGQFEITTKVPAWNYHNISVKLFAADTKTDDPNFGLVDSTKILFQEYLDSRSRCSSH